MGNCVDERPSSSQGRSTVMRVLDLYTKGGTIGETGDKLIRLMRDTQNEPRQPLGFQQFDLHLQEWLSHDFDHRLRTVISERLQASAQTSRQNYSLWNQRCLNVMPRTIRHRARRISTIKHPNLRMTKHRSRYSTQNWDGSGRELGPYPDSFGTPGQRYPKQPWHPEEMLAVVYLVQWRT